VNGPDGIATWDGTHLRLKFQEKNPGATAYSLDLTFDREHRQWNGAYGRNGVSKQVQLLRPKSPTAGNDPRIGYWKSVESGGGRHSGSLHLLQGADGAWIAWMDRKLAPQDCRYGERLEVKKSDFGKVILAMTGGIGLPWQFAGAVSDDGSRLEGEWKPQMEGDWRGMGLNAPVAFVRSSE
jgi:hypothetical protein